MITPAQCRGARAMLKWKREDLAMRAGVSEASVKNLEDERLLTGQKVGNAIRAAFEAAGVVFLEPGANRDGGAGVRFRA